MKILSVQFGSFFTAVAGGRRVTGGDGSSSVKVKSRSKTATAQRRLRKIPNNFRCIRPVRRRKVAPQRKTTSFTVQTFKDGSLEN